MSYHRTIYQHQAAGSRPSCREGKLPDPVIFDQHVTALPADQIVLVEVEDVTTTVTQKVVLEGGHHRRNHRT